MKEIPNYSQENALVETMAYSAYMKTPGVRTTFS